MKELRSTLSPIPFLRRMLKKTFWVSCPSHEQYNVIAESFDEALEKFKKQFPKKGIDACHETEETVI